jgi:hypothetical protein
MEQPMPEASQATSHSTMVTVLSLALQAVSQRIVVLLAMAVTSGLFGWSMYERTWISVATAACFAVLVFLPVLIRSGHNAQNG